MMGSDAATRVPADKIETAIDIYRCSNAAREVVAGKPCPRMPTEDPDNWDNFMSLVVSTSYKNQLPDPATPAPDKMNYTAVDAATLVTTVSAFVRRFTPKLLKHTASKWLQLPSRNG